MKYETVIGLETHIQLKTKSKAFCGDDAAFGGDPNTQVSIISLAHPGTLPRPNRTQIDYAVKLGLAIGCTINRENRFDRKNYFYADLPKGYQITQDELPICLGGQVLIRYEGKEKTINITRIHMEEDAGKSIHDQDPRHTFIDLNRAGVPLLEMVSEPELSSAEEVYAYIAEIRKLVRYLDISDGNMEEGSLRCDINVSVREKGSKILGTRCEIKNINSLRFAKKAIAYEVKRQIGIIEAGGSIKQCTLSFDPNTGRTAPMRGKENAHDYRYFPDPDISPIRLTEEYIQSIKDEMPVLPETLIQQFTQELGLSAYDAVVLTEDRYLAEYYLQLTRHTIDYKTAANWLTNVIKSYLNGQQIDIQVFEVPPAAIAELMNMVEKKVVSYAAASQKLFPALAESPDKKPLELAKSLNLLQDSDADSIEDFVDAALAKFPDKVKAYQKGKKGVIGLFMGEVMRLSKGKANPKMANKLLREKLK